MLDAKRLLDQFIGTPGGPEANREPGAGGMGTLGNMLSGSLGGIGGGAVAGGLAALVLGSKQGRKLAGSALQLGGVAVVGALAYRAYQNWQSGKNFNQSTVGSNSAGLLPPPSDTPFAPARESEQQILGRHLLGAMISAAKADGHVDAKEQATIFAEMDKLNLSADDKAFVIDELRKPLDVDAVAKAARTPEEAASIYAASLLAIDVDNPSERAYLGLLAARLGLDSALVTHLHATVEGVTEPAARTAVAG
ncbi:tellurite resistance TerB family protein [Bradyrhizobium sp. URHD0069]|uniref:tellurite resistance TerB family protein n=1 Tax=Bradyrhizobium sp. URHD0069 TaxID=1380355 RepID=UPI0009DD9153|nr:tellurite resistance TerB family protein [Bradyrhizobium sp. URHD0069]